MVVKAASRLIGREIHISTARCRRSRNPPALDQNISRVAGNSPFVAVELGDHDIDGRTPDQFVHFIDARHILVLGMVVEIRKVDPMGHIRRFQPPGEADIIAEDDIRSVRVTPSND